MTIECPSNMQNLFHCSLLIFSCGRHTHIISVQFPWFPLLPLAYLVIWYLYHVSDFQIPSSTCWPSSTLIFLEMIVYNVIVPYVLPWWTVSDIFWLLPKSRHTLEKSSKVSLNLVSRGCMMYTTNYKFSDLLYSITSLKIK